MRFSLLLASVFSLLICPYLRAHPLFEETYDRNIVVRVAPRGVTVDYTLEVDTQFATADAVNRMTQQEVRTVIGREAILDRFVRDKVTEIAAGLLLRLDGRTLTLRCASHRWEQRDHLFCQYRFEGDWKLESGNPHDFLFREANFHDEKGSVRLSLVVDESIRPSKLIQPDEALKNKPDLELAPGDRDRLRLASALLETTRSEAKAGPAPVTEESPSVLGPPRSLLDLLFESDRGLLVLLGLAFVLGAAHALTPGHGKTLVAAYLVGERGTFGHAVLLGVVTALTHTGIILLIAAVLPWFFPEVSARSMQQLLGFVGGLLIVALGFWLLQRRLSGKADHVHIGGGYHHHHHGDHDHHHLPPGQAISLRALVTLGISGGIVPCGEALALFIVALRSQQASRAFILLVAFSVGLACVLVAIGLCVVYARRLAVSQWGESDRLKRVVRTLPIISAVLITALGLWLCYDSVHGVTH